MHKFGGIVAMIAAALIVCPLRVFAHDVIVVDAMTPYTVLSPTTIQSLTVKSNGVATINAPLTVVDFVTIEAGGRITIDNPLDPFGYQRLELQVGGTVDIQVGGTIDVTAKGLAPGKTIVPATGAVGLFACDWCGGSHFVSGSDVNASSIPGFDEPLNPRLPGSGGFSGRGGGAIVITAQSMIIEGSILADGEDRRVAGGAGSGAGGALNIRAEQISGNGLISVAGGLTGGNSSTPASAGGLVYFESATNTYSGTIAVEGGNGGTNGTAIHFDPSTRALSVLAGAYFVRDGEVYSSLTLKPWTTAKLIGRASITAPIEILVNTTLQISHPRALDHVKLAAETGSWISGRLGVHVALSLPYAINLRGELTVNDTLTVSRLNTESGAVIQHAAKFTKMHLVATESINLALGAQISAAGMGLALGRTIDPLTGKEVTGSGFDNGGSHAGRGGYYSIGDSWAETFDDPNNPQFGGGGGGTRGGGGGGGVIRVTSPLLNVAGLIDADGSGGSAGGAGGSIVLKVGALTGSGQIRARGYTTPDLVFGGGGGGIINISYVTSTFPDVNLSVAGGSGLKPGESGVIVKNVTSIAPTLVSPAPSFIKVNTTFNYAPIAVGTPPFTWSLGNHPTGASIDAATGAVTWTPTAEELGIFELVVTNTFGSDTQTFSVSAMVPPAFTSEANPVVAPNQPYHYDDDDKPNVSGSAPFTWSTTLSPEGFSIDAATGVITWTPTTFGAYPICIEVSNSVGKGTQCYAVNVTRNVVTLPDGGTIDSDPSDNPIRFVTCGCTQAGVGPFALAILFLLRRRAGARQNRT